MGREGRTAGASGQSGEKEKSMTSPRFDFRGRDNAVPFPGHNPARRFRGSPRVAAFSLLVALTSVAAAATAPAKQNIILILADDLGWADLSCYGNTFNETPNIDRMAKQGVRFTQFYAGPVCSPTRASIQSGQNQARVGITVHIPGHWKPFA